MSAEDPHVIGELSRFLDGQLPRADRRRVSDHLERCESCRQHYEQLHALRARIAETPSMLPPSPWKRHRFKLIAAAVVLTVTVWVARKARHPSAAPAQVPVTMNEPKPALRVVKPVPKPPAPADPSVTQLRELADTPTAAPAPAPAPLAEPAATEPSVSTATEPAASAPAESSPPAPSPTSE